MSTTLRHRITIRTPTEVADGRGGVTRTFASHRVVWANVVPSQAFEALTGGQRQMTRTHRVQIRYRSDIDGDMEILFGSRTFQIVGIMDKMEKRRWTILDCVENVN